MTRRKKREKFFDFRSVKAWVELFAILFVIGWVAFGYYYGKKEWETLSPEEKIEARKERRFLGPK